jgi:hypothetical protein
MKLYEKYDEHAANNARFRVFMSEYPYLKFFQPSPVAAPWHVQVKVRLGPYDRLVNFWPHVAKMQPEDGKTVHGWDAIERSFDRLILDDYEDTQVIE